jgi:RluA family pseudouridine synthase
LISFQAAETPGFNWKQYIIKQVRLMLKWIVLPEESGSKLIAFLTQRLGERYSSRFLKRVIEHNRCQINERTERFASTILGKGDYVTLDLTGFDIPSNPLQFEPDRVLYEDQWLLIYNKPAGINSDEKGILSLLRYHDPKLQLIHRLDKETTGLLLLAKQDSTFKKMVQLFKEFKVHKRYMAIVDGVLSKDKGTIENYLGKKHHYAGQTIWGNVSQDKGLYACTDWIKKAEGKGASLLYCFPKTGRTHQIRVHLAGINHPLLGDFQYCKHFRCSYRPDRYLLHADEISFQHPEIGQLIQIQAPLPEDFLKAMKIIFKQKIQKQ